MQRFYDPLKAAIINVFAIQFSRKVEVTELKKFEEWVQFSGAMIEFEGPRLRGRMRILFPETTLIQLFESMVGDDAAQNSESDDKLAAATEILNIVYASARTEMNLLGGQFLPAIPEAIAHQAKGRTHWPSSIQLKCSSDLGPFAAEFVIEESG